MNIWCMLRVHALGARLKPVKEDSEGVFSSSIINMKTCADLWRDRSSGQIRNSIINSTTEEFLVVLFCLEPEPGNNARRAFGKCTKQWSKLFNLNTTLTMCSFRFGTSDNVGFMCAGSSLHECKQRLWEQWDTWRLVGEVLLFSALAGKGHVWCFKRARVSSRAKAVC